MISRRAVWLFCAALLAALPLRAVEQNVWPFAVRQVRPDGTLESGEYLGPLFFEQNAAGRSKGFRPVFLTDRTGDKESNALFYPFFTWEKWPDESTFSFFMLVNRRRQTGADQPTVHHFDVWPFYFSKDTGDPATTYHALFPIAGTIKNRFGKDRLTWYAFPLYFNTDKDGMQVTSAPWPFIRVIDGAGHHGFEFWPLFGSREHPGDYRKRFWLWPLFYQSETHLADPTPSVSLGALPFYTRDTGPGLISETYVWPFFGYTHRTDPVAYDEQRYFWPFLVQGRGPQHYVNRWAPFYTHSITKGYDKTWALWPLYRHATWSDAGIAQEKNQVLFFVYWSLTQRSLTNPAAAAAHKTHLWPLFSVWDNGAGRRQVQVLSPFEVFFPQNDPIRQLYTPLFALYRYDARGSAESRHSLLWGAVTYRRGADGKEFHLGPLFSVQTGGETRRIALGSGVLGWQRRPGEAHGRFFLFDFKPKPATKADESPPP